MEWDRQMEWMSVEERPDKAGPYLVFMPERSLDQFSCQHFDKIDGWSNDFGITHWLPLPDPPEDV